MLLLLELEFVLKTGVTAVGKWPPVASKHASSLGLELKTLAVRPGAVCLRTVLPLFIAVTGCGTLATAAAWLACKAGVGIGAGVEMGSVLIIPVWISLSIKSLASCSLKINKRVEILI